MKEHPIATLLQGITMAANGSASIAASTEKWAQVAESVIPDEPPEVREAAIEFAGHVAALAEAAGDFAASAQLAKEKGEALVRALSQGKA